MSLGHSIRHGAKWVFIGNTGSQVVNFALGLILARLLVPAEFGMVATIQIFTSLAGFVAGGGMGQAIVRAKEASKRDYDLLFTLQFLIGLMIVSFFFVIAPWFGRWYANPVYADLLRVAALSFLVRPFFNVPSNMLHREMRFKAKTAVQLTNLAVYNSIALSLAYLGYGPWSLILAGLFGSISGALQFSWYARWRPGICFDFARAGELMRYGLLATSNNVVSYLQSQVTIFILSRSGNATLVGLFNKALSLAYMPFTMISGSAYEPVFRAIAQSADNPDRVRYLYLQSIRLGCIYTYPIYVLLYWLAPEAIRFFYGANWLGSAEPLSILIFAGFFMSIGHPAGALLAAINLLGKELVIQLVNLVILILGMLIAIPYGLKGAAWVVVFSQFVGMTYITFVACQAIRIRFVDIAHAVIPAAVHAIILLVSLAVLEKLTGNVIQGDFLTLAFFGTAAAGIIVLGGLFSPFEAMRAESKKMIGVVRNRLALAGNKK
ncbi:lipopolysaccharide biosynthesis protein [Thiobacillus sp. 0-1251]|uniref:lipopolysaccharide biosynthesis protein n=1 Tax=Thiobacillus sp. 0-1251 TaxID=1895858 RepID=UPI0009622D55|nr:lipopolysaccharide biosynthesis protein [Thiobacillus sp. 0-1251]OJY56359.1 MAG: lipopolysaccharide biosynthesis protein [Thiobacillus sp. 0-1251]